MVSFRVKTCFIPHSGLHSRSKYSINNRPFPSIPFALKSTRIFAPIWQVEIEEIARAKLREHDVEWEANIREQEEILMQEEEEEEEEVVDEEDDLNTESAERLLVDRPKKKTGTFLATLALDEIRQKHATAKNEDKYSVVIHEMDALENKERSHLNILHSLHDRMEASEINQLSMPHMVCLEMLDTARKQFHMFHNIKENVSKFLNLVEKHRD